MKRQFALVALLGLVLVPELAHAQRWGLGPGTGSRNFGVRTRYGRWYAMPPNGYGYYGGPYGWGNGAPQTPGSAYLYGQAQVIAAQGQSQRSRAQARLANEQARSQYLENRKKWEQVLYQRKLARNADKARKKAEREARRRNKPPRPAPPGLSADQYDRYTGEIHWPEGLQGREFAEDREKVESLLKMQARGGSSVASGQSLVDAARRMQKQVTGKAKKLGFAEYSELRKFVRSLAVEGQRTSVGDSGKTQPRPAAANPIEEAIQLSEMGLEGAVAVPTLVGALASDDEQLQHRVLEALGRIGLGAKDASAEVARFLDSDSKLLQHTAIETLRRIGASEPQTLARLRELTTESEPLTSVAAVWSVLVLDPNAADTVKEDIPKLLTALGNQNPHVRNDASVALAGIGRPAVSAVTAVLDSKNRDRRMKACETLGLIGSDADTAVEPLIERLGDSDAMVVRQAMMALGNIGPGAAASVPALSKLIGHESPAIRSDAAMALAGIGIPSKSAVGDLVTMLKDEHSNVRMAAATALGAIGPDAAAASDSLVAALADSAGGVTISVTDALAQIGAPAIGAIRKMLKDDNYRQLALSIVSEIGPDARNAVPELVSIVETKNGEAQRDALIAIAAVGPDAANLAAPILLKLLQDDEGGEGRRSAAFALTKMKVIEAIPVLRKIVSESKDQKLLLTASWALVNFDPTNAAYAEVAMPHFQTGLRNESDLVRSEVAITIGDMGETGIGARENLVRLVREDDSPKVRSEAIHTLVSVGDRSDELLKLAVEALADPDATVRNTGRYALGKLGTKAAPAAPRLRETLKLGSPLDRIVSAWALTQVAPSGSTKSETVPVLLEGLQYPEPQVRSEAAAMLGLIGDKTAAVLDGLKQAATDENESVRKAAAKAIENLD